MAESEAGADGIWAGESLNTSCPLVNLSCFFKYIFFYNVVSDWTILSIHIGHGTRLVLDLLMKDRGRLFGSLFSLPRSVLVNYRR